MGRVWFSSHSIEMKFSLDNWSILLQDGVTLFGSDNDLISIEGISTVGLLVVVFRLILGMVFCHPGFVRLALKSGGVFHIQLSSLLVRTLCVSLSPTKEWVLALLLLALLPLALPLWVCLLRQPSGVSFTRVFFHARVFCAWWLASNSSGSRASREWVLACIQGASDSLRHPSPGGETETSAFDITVRVLLRSTPLSHCMVSSPATGRGLSVSALKGYISALWPCGVVVACLLHTQEVPGSIPGRGSYLRQVSLH